MKVELSNFELYILINSLEEYAEASKVLGFTGFVNEYRLLLNRLERIMEDYSNEK